MHTPEGLVKIPFLFPSYSLHFLGILVSVVVSASVALFPCSVSTVGIHRMPLSIIYLDTVLTGISGFHKSRKIQQH